MTFTRLPLALATAVLLAACATPPAPTPPSPPPAAPTAATAPAATVTPAYLLAPTGCAVVAGGNLGSRFTDAKVGATWARVNAAIAKELQDRLAAERYRTTLYVVPTEGSDAVENLLMRQMAEHRCSRLLQIAHTVNEDADGRFFRFDVTLFRATPREGAAAQPGSVPVTATAEYRRSYRRPRTQAELDNFYTGTFAEQVLADLVRAGALTPLR